MPHKLDIGVCSFRNPEKLKRALDSIYANTRTPFELNVWHNWEDLPGIDQTPDDEACLRVLEERGLETIGDGGNVGYAGAVNGLIAASVAPYFAYCDNDVEILTPGWDERFIDILSDNPECGQVFPGAGHYGFHNGRYHECLWNAGYCWMLRSSVLPEPFTRQDDPFSLKLDPGPMDLDLGHHEEVDLMIRLRLAGFQIGCVPDVQVLHHETATSSPESAKRIHRGVVSWMNKWNRYFVGDAIKYPNPDPDSGEGYDPRTLRYTDFPPCALYLERWTLAQFPEWNARERRHYDQDGNPGDMRGYREVETSAGPMDAIEILKPKGCYRGRAI